MPKNINCITIIIILKGTEKIKTRKMTTKQPEEYFFHKHMHCKKTATNIVMLLDFDCLITSNDHLILAFHWFISVG